MPVHRDAEGDAEQDVRRRPAWILGEEKDRETGEHPGQDRDPVRPEGMKSIALGRHGDPMWCKPDAVAAYVAVAMHDQLQAQLAGRAPVERRVQDVSA